MYHLSKGHVLVRVYQSGAGGLRWVVFFLSGSPPISTVKVIESKFGYSEFWDTKRALQGPSDLFRVGGPHSTDSELRGHPGHFPQIHHAISQP